MPLFCVGLRTVWGATELAGRKLHSYRSCIFLKKLRKGREIIDFTAFSGGDEEDRTLDLTDANRTLSQLSYAPKLPPDAQRQMILYHNFLCCKERIF